MNLPFVGNHAEDRYQENLRREADLLRAKEAQHPGWELCSACEEPLVRRDALPVGRFACPHCGKVYLGRLGEER